MTVFSQSAWLEALGWTLVNSWWQFGILWMVWLLIQKVWPRASSASRYNLAVGFLLTGTIWAIIGFIGRYLNLPAAGAGPATPPAIATPASWPALQELPSLIFPLISILYLAWLAYKLSHLFIQLRSIRSLANSGLRKVPVQWRIFTEAMSAQMNLARKAQVWLSDKIDSPQIMGTLKPIILLPASAISQLSPDQLEAILIHELAHIKRNDYIWNWVVSIIETIFFFNVFVKLFISAIREEREHACDDWVLQFPFQPSHYAKALLTLEKGRSGKEDSLVLAAGGTSRKLLLTRVRRILNLPEPEQKSRISISQIGGYLMAALIVMASLSTSRLQTIKISPTPLVAHPNKAGFRTVAKEWFELNLEGESTGTTPPTWVETRPDNNNRGNLSSNLKSVKPSEQTTNQTDTENTGDFQATDTRLQLQWVAQSDDQEGQRITIVQAVEEKAVEAQAFTLEKTETGEIPAEAANIYLHPYVPKRSFEFLPVAPDTVKALSIQLEKAKAAQEAMLETRIALSKVNWEEMKELMAAAYGRAQAEELLVKELANLDWQEIREEVNTYMNELAKAIPDSLRQALVLQEQLKQQQQSLRQQALELRQKALELRQQQLQARKKQKIVHL